MVYSNPEILVTIQNFIALISPISSIDKPNIRFKKTKNYIPVKSRKNIFKKIYIHKTVPFLGITRYFR